MGSHRVRHDWSDLAAAAPASHRQSLLLPWKPPPETWEHLILSSQHYRASFSDRKQSCRVRWETNTFFWTGTLVPLSDVRSTASVPERAHSRPAMTAWLPELSLLVRLTLYCWACDTFTSKCLFLRYRRAVKTNKGSSQWGSVPPAAFSLLNPFLCLQSVFAAITANKPSCGWLFSVA